MGICNKFLNSHNINILYRVKIGNKAILGIIALCEVGAKC